MKPGNFAPRILAVVLSACLILPPHAYALRSQQQQETEPQHTGLEEALRSGDPDTLIRVASSRLAQWLPAPASAPVVSSSGLEEAVQAGVRRIQDRWVYFVLAVPDTLGESTSAAVLGWLDRIAALGARAGRQSSVVLITRPSNYDSVQAAISRAKMEWSWVRLVGVGAVSSPAAGQDMQVALGAVRKELNDVHAERHKDGTVEVDKTGNFRSDERDLMLLSAGQSPPSEDLLLAALGTMKGFQLAEVQEDSTLIATLVRGDLADGLSAGTAGPAPEKIQLKGGPKGVSATGSPTGLAGYELFTLPPPNGVVRSFGNYEEFVRFSADEIKSRYENFLKNAPGKKHFWVLVTGTGGSGKTTFIRGTEVSNPTATTDLLQQLRSFNIPVVSINEDWWAATAKARDDLRDSGHPADGADYADSRRTWVRWPALRAAFRALADTVGSITLKELHNYAKPGKLIDREQTLDLSEKSVIVVEGHFLDDPWLIPGDWFDMQILLGRTYESIFAIRRNRARWPDRPPARTQWNEDVVFRSTWWKHIRRNHPEWTSDLVFDLNDFNHPKQLSYSPPESSWVDDHRNEVVSLQSFAREVVLQAANKLVELHDNVTILDSKSDNTSVTEADYAVQEMVVRAILTKYPDHYVDAEEDPALFKPNDLKLKKFLRRNEQNRGKADVVWVVDPLDGTSTYKTKGKGYAFALGILYLGQPLYAAILSPESDMRYEADPVRGIVTLNGKELSPFQLRAGRPVVVVHGSESIGIPHPNQEQIKQIADLAGKPSSIALTTSGVAGNGGEDRDLDAVSSVVTKTNDAIPPSILLTTLGGKAVHPDGRPIFPVTWRDLSVPDREMRVIAGVPAKVKSLYQIVKGSPEEKSIGISYSYLKLGEVQEVERYSELLTGRIREDLGSLLSQEPNKWVIVSPGGFGIPNAASLISAKVAQLLSLPHVTLETGLKVDPALVQQYASFARREDRSLVVHGIGMGEADVDVLRGKNAIVIDDAIMTGNILKHVFTLLTQTGLVRIEPYVLVRIDGLGDNAFEDRVNRKVFERDGLRALVQVLNDNRSIYTTRLVHYVSELSPEQFHRLLAQLTPSAKLNLYLYSIEYFSSKSPSNVDMLREFLRRETQSEFPSVQTLRAIQSEKFFKTVGSMLESYHFKVPLHEASTISQHLKNLLLEAYDAQRAKDHPVQQGSGLEEAIWPDTSALALRSIEPILILQAEGGFGDVAYLRKLLDAFNARGLTPVVAAVGTPEKQADAMEKFERFTAGAPVSYTLWREQAGRLVQADGRPVERGRTLRPVLIQHFSQVNPNWSRDLTERLVPELFQPLYESPGSFFLIGFNAPGNAFGGYLKPGQGEFLNLYQTPPTQPGVHEPNPIYTGNLFDLELKKMIEEIRPLSRKTRRAAALGALKLPEELAEAAKSKGGWASLYISQGGSPTQLEALTQAFSDSYGTAAFFTFFGKNPRLWYYPDDYWRPHEEIVNSLKKNPKVSFVDVSGIFDSRERPDAPILVVNLGRVTREGVRLLAGASDLMLAPGHNTFVNAMGMAASQVGPKVVLSMPVFRAEREELQQALRSMGARRTLEEIAAFDRLREPGLAPEVFDAAVERLTRLLKSRKRQQRFQRDIARLATRAMGLSGDPTDGNLGNRLLDLLARVDRGAALTELVSAPRQTPEAVEEVRDYQRQAAEAFRRTRQEPQFPHAAGLEEVAGAMERWFGPKSARAGEKRLADFLAARGEGAIREFVRRIEEDRGLPSGSLGPYEIPPFDSSQIPPAGLTSAGFPIPSAAEAYEKERLRLMAEVAIQRALGRQLVVNVGIGFVGATVMIANAQARTTLAAPSFAKPLQYRATLSGKRQSPYFVLGYNRPSTDSYYKVEHVNQGLAPIRTVDRSIERKIKEAHHRGNIRATFLKEAIAVADFAIVDTELHVRKLAPRHLELSRTDPGPTLRLLGDVGRLIPKEATVLIESTVYPGFTLYDALPVINEQLRKRGLLEEGEDAPLAYSFQRVEPGPRLFKSLMELQRVGAGVTPKAREELRRYYETVGFNYRIWDETTTPEFIKDVENAYRFGLIELMGAFLRGAELAGVNAFEVIEAIASARPETHGTIRFSPALQVGGYCIPKELVMVILGLKSHFGFSDLQIRRIFHTRLAAAVASDFRAESAVVRLLESLADVGLSPDESTIHWMGVAYNPGVGDTRYSGTERGLRLAAHYGARNEATDPYVHHWPELQQQRLGDPESWGYGLLNQEGLRELEVQATEDPYETIHPRQDALVLATRHPLYVGQGQPEAMRTFVVEGKPNVYPGLDPVRVAARMMGREGKVILDSFNFLSDEDIKTFLALGFKVRGFGKGHLHRLAEGLTAQERREAAERLLEELPRLRGMPGIPGEELEEAIQTVEEKVRYLRVLDQDPPDAETIQLAEARTQLAQARQERRYAKPGQIPLAEARVRWAEARLKPSIPEVETAFQQVEELTRQRNKTVLANAQSVLVRPAQEEVQAVFRKAASLMEAFRLMEQERLLVLPHSVEEAVQMAESYLYLRGRGEELALDVDRAFEELVTPGGKVTAAVAIRKAQARPELAFPEKAVAVVYAQGADGRLRRSIDPEGYPNRLSVKTIPDMAQGKRNIPQGRPGDQGDWTKHTKLVPLNLVQAEDIELEAYPDFQELPWEFRHWLLTEVIGKGYVLSTMKGVPQDKFGYAMDVNLDPKTWARGRGGILFFTDTRQPLIITTEQGKELIVDIKAVGPYGGGDSKALGLSFDRVTATGMVSGGAVGRMQVGQVAGHMSSAEEIPRLHRLMRTEEAHQGQAPRPLFRVRWKYKEGPDMQFQMVARASPTNRRIGQIFIGGEEDFNPAQVARIMGENAARVLTQPIAGVHEGLNGDNILATGHYTDLAGQIDLFNERDPLRAFYKYFGFYLMLVSYSFEDISKSNYSQPDSRFVQGWLSGFFEKFLSADRGAQVRNPHRFKRFYQVGNQLSQPTAPGSSLTALIEDLIKTVWEQYLPYRLLKSRLEYGYNPTEESTYSAGSLETIYHPESAQAAREFIEDQRELLQIAERLMTPLEKGGEGYVPLKFDFQAAYQEIEAKAHRIEEIVATGPKPDSPVYAEIYRLKFYPPKAPEVYPVLADIEAMTRGEEAVRLVMKVAEPTAFFDKTDVGAQAQLAARKAREASAETRVAVISERAAAGTGLEELAGQPRRIGDAWLWVLPSQMTAARLAEGVAPLMDRPNIVFQEYGGLEEFAQLNAMIEGLAAIQGPRALTGKILLDALRQIVANLSGLEEGAVSGDQLDQVERALGLEIQL